MKFVVLFLIIAAVFLFDTNQATAHVLLTDSASRVGAILHVFPDDDPIAGESANLYFDIQKDNLEAEVTSAVLTVIDDQGIVSEVPIHASGNGVSADYIFPKQGVYIIELKADVGDTPLNFSHTQRVSRGISTTAMIEQTRFVWAEIAGIISVGSLLLLIIFFSNNRRDIARQSL